MYRAMLLKSVMMTMPVSAPVVVLAVNSQTRTLTLDREITLPSSGTTLISPVDGSGNPVSVEVQSVTDGVKVK
ncbi:hypothetical protein ECZU36_44520 [Escherichia coli]|nr:hypothetical protein ECZU36_44520 [Escherichia coli]